jgi:DNA-binding MarR family transcriptional regulator
LREFLEREEPATATARLLFIALWSRADARKNYTCSPSIARLAQDIGTDRTTVIAATKQLEALDLIAVDRDPRFDRKTRKRRVNVYTVPPLPRTNASGPHSKNPLKKEH